MTPKQIRDAVFMLAERTGWPLSELSDLDEQELLCWLETGNHLRLLAEGNSF